AELDDLRAARNFLPDRLVAVERVAALVDIAELHGLADADRAAVGLFLAGDHLEQRRVAGAVRADNADDAARRQLDRQVVGPRPAVKALLDAFQLVHHVAEALRDRDDDLGVAGPDVFRRIDQLFVGLEAGLGLGLAGLRAGRDPFLLAR